MEGYPAIDGVIRVDSYWCHSTIIADNSSNNESEGVKGDVDSPGLRFVTLFCDDQRVPLPAALVDIISAQGEKVVPGAIERLHEVAYQIQQQQQPNRSS